MWKKKMDDESEGKGFTDEEMEEMLHQFEKDSQTHDFSDPDMDRIFQESLNEVVKSSRKKMIYKCVGMAASVVIVLSAMLNCFTQVAYGESLFDIVKNSIQNGQFTITSISKNNDSQFEQVDVFVRCYEADSIETLFEKVINDNNIAVNELFYVKDMPNEYKQWTAKYNEEFQKLSISLQEQDAYWYILEELNYENLGSAVALQSEIVSTVFNEYLQQNIHIIAQMDNLRCSGYYIELLYDNKRFRIEGNGTLEEFEVIAQNIVLLKGD